VGSLKRGILAEYLGESPVAVLPKDLFDGRDPGTLSFQSAKRTQALIVPPLE